MDHEIYIALAELRSDLNQVITLLQDKGLAPKDKPKAEEKQDGNTKAS